MNNLQGILLVLLAMAAFTVEDVFVKQLSATIHVGQILFGLGVGSSIIFAVSARLRGKRLLERKAWRGVTLVRAAAEAVAAIAFATALSLIDISVVATVFQATPLAITMGAALFLGEDVGWRRWTAIIVGFIGVLLIVRPGLSAFEPNTLWVIAAVFSVAARDLVTRKIDSSIDSTVVSFQGFFALLLTGPLYLWGTGHAMQALGPVEWQMMILGIIFGAIGYYGIVAAMRIGEASAIMPFRYARLIFSMIAGVLIFNERPDAVTLMGAGLIIGSGLYTFLRERRLAAVAQA